MVLVDGKGNRKIKGDGGIGYENYGSDWNIKRIYRT